MKVGILGLGTLGGALARGLQEIEDVEIASTTRTTRESNNELARWSDVLVICVKPFHVQDVIGDIAPELRESLLLISTAASVRLKQLGTWAQWRCPIVRAMPNMPCRVAAGMTVLAAGTEVCEEELSLARSLFEPLGRVAVLDESLMDAATGLSACGPAYAYLIIEALSEAGVKLGVPRRTATLLAAQTLFGAAHLVLESGAHPAALKDEVTTPAGCTVDALTALEEGRLRSTLMNAVVAAASRSASLVHPE